MDRPKASLRRMMVLLAVGIPLFVAYPAARTAQAQAVNDLGQWSALFAQGDLQVPSNEDLSLKWWFDGHLRLLDDSGGYNQSIIRPGVGLPIGDSAAVWAGYAWIDTTPIRGPNFDEHRIWQQFTWGDSLADWQFAYRSRFEQRFLETGDDVGLRFRQLLRAQHKLPNLPRLSFVVWDELFFHLNDTDWGATAGFDQNRVFVGLGWKPDEKSRWRVEAGYLNQFLEIPNANDRVHHILSVNVFVQ
jgi:hypothetical protein